MNLIEKLLERDILVGPDQFESLTEGQVTQLTNSIDDLSEEQILAFFKKGTVEILKSYTKKPRKREYQDFVGHFNNRLQTLSGILQNRSELSGAQSIARIRPNQRVAIIGLVWEVSETKNGHIMLELEDKTGITKVLISKKREDLLAIAKDITHDEVIGITGMCGQDIVFADAIYHPDVPASNELKKAPDEVYALVIGDLHFGIKDFYKTEFEKFLSWITGESGSDKLKEIARKVKYLFIVGDLIEGVGVYPSQEQDLEIIDIKEQYAKFAEYIKKIPSHIQIIVCPGNHDAGRLAEPQFTLYTDFTQDVLDLPNLHFVSNPGYVRIHRTSTFEGFTVLMYHGMSYFYYGNYVPSIFEQGSVNRPDLIMKHLLTRRHLAPTHTSTRYIPDPVADPLTMTEVPDFYLSGHLHMSSATNYKGVSMISCSCWTPATEYQEAAGLTLDFAKVPLINLQTRKVTMLNFLKNEEKQS